MDPAVILTGVVGLFTTAVAFFTAKGKTLNDGKTSNRDDFTVIVDKFKEIIDYREAQIEQQQKQIDTLISENKEMLRQNQLMKAQMSKLMEQYEDMREALSTGKSDPDMITKINKIYNEVKAH